MPWFVVYTQPKHEKKVAAALDKLGVEVFCPTITEVRQWSDRKKELQVPLFKSYVFVNIEEKQRHEVLNVRGVVRYLFWLGKPAIVRDIEIQTLRNWLNDEQIEDVEVHNFQAGEEIIIPSGLLKDKTAIIREVGKKRLKLILPGMGFSVEVRISEMI